MCLRVQLGKPAETHGFGWKVLCTCSGTLHSAVEKTTHWEVNAWLDARFVENLSSLNRRTLDYHTLEDGFHIYKRKKDALMRISRFTSDEKMVIAKVEYDGAFLEGTGDGGWNHSAEVIVAKRARLIEVEQPKTQKSGE